MPEMKNNESTKDLILTRLREYSDFPAMSNTIKIINRFNTKSESSISEFASIVLRDYALTTKVLKIVNSVNYSQFGEVTTISRAIALLGIENIKNLALTLMLFEHFQKRDRNLEHIDAILKSLYSGILAQNISSLINYADKEEAYICSLFHTFGKVLVSFAMPEKIKEIDAMALEQGISGDAAATSVLGGNYEDIGMAIAQDWNFPEHVVRSMHKLSGTEIKADNSTIYKLNSIASFTNNITDIISTGDEKTDMDERIGQAITMFKPQFGMLYDGMAGIINASFETLKEFSSLFNVNLFDAIPFNRKFLAWSNKEVKAGKTGAPVVRVNYNPELIKTIDTIFESEKMDSPDHIFAKGIQDINVAILSNYSLNNIMRIVLETMYRGMQLSGEAKALFLIKDTKLPTMSIRFGFGNGVEGLKKWFNIPLGGANDIFNIAITKQNDFVIQDIEPPDIRSLLPQWFKTRVFEKIFIVLLPIVINTKPIGMFYLEGAKESFGKISGSHLNYLRILRDQTVMSIRQKRGTENGVMNLGLNGNSLT